MFKLNRAKFSLIYFLLKGIKVILSKRTKLSLVQFLSMFDVNQINLFLEKYQMGEISQKEKLQQSIEQANDTAIENLVCEIVATRYNLHNKESLNFNDNMQGGFDARFDDLAKCLLLDGYKIDTNNNLIQIEPQLEGVVAFEDELTSELDKSILSAQTKQNIKNLIENSANAFKQNKCNDCLTNARMALETLVRKITSEKFNENKDWQGAIETLRNEEFLTEKERRLIKNTYSFISEACHNFFTDEEYARYGRNLAMSMCYYIIKNYNKSNSSDE